MTTGNLPDPAAPGPIAGEPGHFAHHDYLEAGVDALNERLMKGWKQNGVVSCAHGIWTAAKFDVLLFDTGLDIDSDTVGGGIVFGAGAPEGMYRIDCAFSFAAHASASRQVRATVNGVERVDCKQVIGAASSGGVIVGTSALLYLPAGTVLKVEGYQNSGAALNTGLGCRLHLEFLGHMDAPVEGPASADVDWPIVVAEETA
jgi:hypothetical protein